MPQKYQVKENETLHSIAKTNGFNSIDTIINANLDDWPYLAMHPNVLMTGMTLTIPDKKAKKLDQHTGTSVTYVSKKPAKQFLTLKIEDHLGEIKSVKDDIQLFINGGAVPLNDQTIYDIQPVKFKIIATANPLPDVISDSYLKIKFTSALNKLEHEEKITVDIGGVDPFLDPNNNGYNGKASKNIALRKAAQKLLLNLGCYNGELDGDLDKADSVVALMRFQSRYLQMSSDDEEYGRPGVKTCIGLGFSQGTFLGPIQPINYG